MSKKIPYNQLNDQRKLEIAIDSIGEYWHDTLLEEIADELSDEGFPDADIQYSGFYSQGDGASFTADVNVEHFFNSHLDKMTFKFSGRLDKTDTGEAVNDFLKFIEIEDKFFIKRLIDKDFFRASIVRISNQYVHENSIAASVDAEAYWDLDDEENYTVEDIDDNIFTKEHIKEINEFHEYFENYLDAYVKAKCKEIYKRLEKEYNDFIEAEIEYLESENFLYKP
jgi:hypothetical protein